MRSRTSGSGPLSWLFLVVVVGVVVLVLVRPGLGSDRVGALIATHDIDRGEVLRPADFVSLQRHVNDPSTLAKDADGHVARRDLKAGAAIRSGDLGSDAFATLGRDLTLVAITAPASGALQRLLHPGDDLRVLVRAPGRAEKAYAAMVARAAPAGGGGIELGVLMSRSAADGFMGQPSGADIRVVSDLRR